MALQYLVIQKHNPEYKQTKQTCNKNTNLKFYTGIFDTLDNEKDDQTDLFGIEHRDTELFRDTLLGKFSPITGAFITAEDSIYLYTGIEAEYKVGPISFSPSFSPGYYEKGGGKDLGSVLEFKSEVNVSVDLFESSALGYSYSHISNNDWGTTNPGTNNQTFSFSTKF